MSLHNIKKVIKNKVNKVMSSDREYAEQFQDLLNDNVNVSFQEVQKVQSEQNNDKSLTLQNINSLALFPRPSIEQGIPLTKNMLSQDMYMKESSSDESDSMREEKVGQQVIVENEDQWLVDDLDIPKTTHRKKFPENTKNVLRNFGNAQNQYALYNKEANQIVNNQLSHPETFFKWVRQLKLQNFQGFKAIWQDTSNHSKAFRRVYKKICWKFYVETAIPYVLTSRMKDTKTKMSHLKYLYRFLQGLKNPADFSYFKKIDK